MGLDSVELVMEIEDVFSIEISDEHGSQMQTVGAVYDYIIAAKGMLRTEQDVCLSAAAYYSLRRAIAAQGGSRRLLLSGETEAILPDKHSRGFWRDLQQRSGLRLPSLRRPTWVVYSSLIAVVAFAAAFGSLVGLQAHSPLAGMFFGALAAIVCSLIAVLGTRPFAVLPALDCSTVRELVQVALARNFATLRMRYVGASEQDVWETLRGIVVNQLGVSPEEVTPSAHFVNDLGCD